MSKHISKIFLVILFFLVPFLRAQTPGGTTINGLGGPFTFTGSGVSCTGYVCSFSGGSGTTWGSITGTLSNQTDLQTALNAKLNLTGGTLTGLLVNNYLPTTGTGISQELLTPNINAGLSTYPLFVGVNFSSNNGFYASGFYYAGDTSAGNYGFSELASEGIVNWAVFGNGSTVFGMATPTIGPANGIAVGTSQGFKVDASGDTTIAPTSTTVVPLTVNTPSGSTADLQDWGAAGSAKTAFINQFGYLNIVEVESPTSLTILSTSGKITASVGPNSKTFDFNVLSGWTGTATAGTVVAVGTTTHSVVACAASCTNAFAVVDSNPNSNAYIQTIGSHPVNLDGTYTVTGGEYACASPTTAGTVMPSATLCPTGEQIGYVTTPATSVTTATIFLQFK